MEIIINKNRLLANTIYHIYRYTFIVMYLLTLNLYIKLDVLYMDLDMVNINLDASLRFN